MRLLLVIGLCCLPDTAALAQAGDNLARLWAAIQSKDEAAVVAIVREGGFPIDARDEEGKTLFMRTCQDGLSLAAMALLEAGADLQLKSRGGNPTAGFAIFTNDERLLRKMAEKGVNFHYTTPDGQNALHWVGQTGSHRLIPFLLEQGVDVNGQARDGTTPLMVCAFQNRLKSIPKLLAGGADPFLKMRSPRWGNVTALGIAEWRNNPDAVVLLRAAMGKKPLRKVTSWEGDPW